MLDQLTVSDFDGHVNSMFRILLDSADVSRSGADRSQNDRRKPSTKFARDQAASVLPHLSGSADRLLPQRIYPLEHPSLGKLDIFLVPLGAEGDSEGLHYQAVFN